MKNSCLEMTHVIAFLFCIAFAVTLLVLEFTDPTDTRYVYFTLPFSLGQGVERFNMTEAAFLYSGQNITLSGGISLSIPFFFISPILIISIFLLIAGLAHLAMVFIVLKINKDKEEPKNDQKQEESSGKSGCCVCRSENVKVAMEAFLNFTWIGAKFVAALVFGLTSTTAIPMLISSEIAIVSLYYVIQYYTIDDFVNGLYPPSNKIGKKGKSSDGESKSCLDFEDKLNEMQEEIDKKNSAGVADETASLKPNPRYYKALGSKQTQNTADDAPATMLVLGVFFAIFFQWTSLVWIAVTSSWFGMLVDVLVLGIVLALVELMRFLVYVNSFTSSESNAVCVPGCRMCVCMPCFAMRYCSLRFCWSCYGSWGCCSFLDMRQYRDEWLVFVGLLQILLVAGFVFWRLDVTGPNAQYLFSG